MNHIYPMYLPSVTPSYPAMSLQRSRRVGCSCGWLLPTQVLDLVRSKLSVGNKKLENFSWKLLNILIVKYSKASQSVENIVKLFFSVPFGSVSLLQCITRPLSFCMPRAGVIERNETIMWATPLLSHYDDIFKCCLLSLSLWLFLCLFFKLLTFALEKTQLKNKFSFHQDPNFLSKAVKWFF